MSTLLNLWDKEPGPIGTARLYVAISRMSDDQTAFTYFWVQNPHTFLQFEATIGEEMDRFVHDFDDKQIGSSPCIMSTGTDLPLHKIKEHTFRRICDPVFNGVTDDVLIPKPEAKGHDESKK